MKIATWNLERPTKNGRKIIDIIECLKRINADVLVLTETNECIDLGAAYKVFHTEKLLGDFHKLGDRQVSIFSKYPIIEHYQTFRADTSLCLTFATPFGELTIYGTIIGNFGNKGEQFKIDLEKQLKDFEGISKAKQFCIIGDFNISFSDNFYFTKDGREKLKEAFGQLDLIIMTESITANIDHIVLSKCTVQNKKVTIGCWNDQTDEKARLSDHKGVFVEIFE